jgi:hypothetical protein
VHTLRRVKKARRKCDRKEQELLPLQQDLCRRAENISKDWREFWQDRHELRKQEGAHNHLQENLAKWIRESEQAKEQLAKAEQAYQLEKQKLERCENMIEHFQQALEPYQQQQDACRQAWQASALRVWRYIGQMWQHLWQMWEEEDDDKRHYPLRYPVASAVILLPFRLRLRPYRVGVEKPATKTEEAKIWISRPKLRVSLFPLRPELEQAREEIRLLRLPYPIRQKMEQARLEQDTSAEESLQAESTQR